MANTRKKLNCPFSGRWYQISLSRGILSWIDFPTGTMETKSFTSGKFDISAWHIILITVHEQDRFVKS